MTPGPRECGAGTVGHALVGDSLPVLSIRRSEENTVSERTKQFLVSILHEDMNLDIDRDRLTPDLPLGSSGLGLESLDLVQLAMQAEGKLGVGISDEDTSRIASFTVGELLDYLDQRLGRDPPGMTPSRLRELLAANTRVGLAETTPLDQEFVLDSLALTWMLHELKEQCGLDPDPEEPRLSGVTTIERMAGYLGELSPGGQRDD
jgi:acyl carrier protein